MWFPSRHGSTRSVRLALGAALAMFLSGASAHAVLQPTPGGFTIPALDASQLICADKNVEVCIDQSEGNAALINTQADALVAPEVFQPICTLTFKPIAKGASYHLAFGWYNIEPDPANVGKFLTPTQEELYGMFVLAVGLVQGATVATMFPPAVLNLAQEEAAGRYKGGGIGFWLAGDLDFSTLQLDPTTHALTGLTLNRVFYTQHSLNPGSAVDQTFYQVLTWQSVTFNRSFYFGWEDSDASTVADNDFDDLLFLVSGIQCAGGGEYCDTGELGVCKGGTQQCQKGELTCIQSIRPSDETCNALDDDCNGEVDDGDLCDVGFVCDHGSCVAACNVGEKCRDGLECEGGFCIDPLCVDVVCEMGQACRAGICVGACDGVTCPSGQECQLGHCVDLCEGIECEEGQVCEGGLCLDDCGCRACAAGKTCAPDGRCVDTGCETQACQAGQVCVTGVCKDACEGAVCPGKAACVAGVCGTPTEVDMGAGGSDGAGGGMTILPMAGAPSFSGNEGEGEGGSGDDPPMLGSRSFADPGCACRAGAGPRASALIWLALGAFGLTQRRRRRR